ncbi:MAG: hypothetical protein AAF411_08845 [Myxococcota bacterium]
MIDRRLVDEGGRQLLAKRRVHVRPGCFAAERLLKRRRLALHMYAAGDFTLPGTNEGFFAR